MATFKAGQRVKKVATRRESAITRCAPNPAPIGMVGVVCEIGGHRNNYEIAVLWDDPRYHDSDKTFGGQTTVAPYMIAPLTDGESDQWAIDAVRKVTKPQHIEPVAPKVRERIES